MLRSLGWVARIAVVFNALLVSSCPAWASDISKLDVYGVKLGMTGQQVIQVLQTKYGAKIKLEIIKENSQFGKVRVYDAISFHHGDYDLDVKFMNAIPGGANQPEQVSSAILRSKDYAFSGQRQNEQRDAVEQQFIETVLAQYGKPDMFWHCMLIGCPSLKDGAPYWCQSIDPNEEYSTRSPCQGLRRMFVTVLSARAGYGDSFALVLENPSASNDIRRYVETHEDKTTPKLSSPFQ